MADCCEDKNCEVDALRGRHSRILKTVLVINAVMYVVEMSAGYVARSAALMGDSLDMLGDAMAYGISLYVLGKGAKSHARAAMFKGSVMALLGVLVLFEALFRATDPSLPFAGAMGAVGAAAMAANLACLGLLWKSRGDDLNMHSVWLCSRNDILVNAGVLAAALAVHLTQSRWPDIVIGASVAVVVLRSAAGVLRRAYAQLKE
jgi:cation diffusion facilitator family transporter